MTLIETFSLKPVLVQLKEEGYTSLMSMVCTDLEGKFEIAYTMYNKAENSIISVKIHTKDEADSVGDIYKAAIFEECEIFDMFGVKFNNHKGLERIFMPKGWQGHPLLKSYKMEDERLKWND